MIFWNGYQTNLPHKPLSNQEINTVRITDQNKKTDRENVCNSCHLTKDFSFRIGDCILVRNYRQRSKFDPYYLLEKFCVIDTLANGITLLIENTVSGLCLQRHLNDINLFNVSLPSLPEQAFKNDNITYDKYLPWRNAFDFIVCTPKVSTPKMMNPFKKQILARIP